MEESSSSDVIIVGAGPGGLAASLLLAHSGLNVTIFEKADAVGGRTRLIHKDGYTFDRGPTFFHFPEVCEEIFQAIGLDAHKELGLIPLDPSYRLIFGEGGSIDATSNLDLMTERIQELCGEKNAKGFEKYVLENREKLNRSRNCLNTPWTGFSNLNLRSEMDFQRRILLLSLDLNTPPTRFSIQIQIFQFYWNLLGGILLQQLQFQL